MRMIKIASTLSPTVKKKQEHEAVDLDVYLMLLAKEAFLSAMEAGDPIKIQPEVGSFGQVLHFDPFL